jgi:hypothetical protein
MNDNELFSFYEKIYFHELDRKEKLLARLNLPLAILAAILSFLSYMINNKAPTTHDGSVGVWFWILYFFACICLVMGVWYFWRSWSVRLYDKAIPTLEVIRDYRQSMIELYSSFDDGLEETQIQLKALIASYYVQGASTNALNNDRRGQYLSNLQSFVASTIVFSLLSFLPFYIHTHG